MQMKHTTNKLVALATLSAMSVATLGLGAGTAYAGSKGRRNTTIGLGAITAYGLIKKKKTVAIAGGVGTAIAYSRYRKSKKAEARNRSARRYRYNRSSRR